MKLRIEVGADVAPGSFVAQEHGGARLVPFSPEWTYEVLGVAARMLAKGEILTFDVDTCEFSGGVLTHGEFKA